MLSALQRGKECIPLYELKHGKLFEFVLSPRIWNIHGNASYPHVEDGGAVFYAPDESGCGAVVWVHQKRLSIGDPRHAIQSAVNRFQITAPADLVKLASGPMPYLLGGRPLCPLYIISVYVISFREFFFRFGMI